MKDCFERWSLPTCDEAHNFCRWFMARDVRGPVPFHCHRCGRWHIAAGHEEALRSRRMMQRERCVSDRDLHLQLARMSGVSLDEFQIHNDLSKIRLAGPGFEVIKIKAKQA